MTQHQTRKHDVIALAYDNLNRLITKTPPSPAPVVSYAYDLAGHPIGVSDNSSSIAAVSGSAAQFSTSLTYDALNQPTNVSWSPAATQSTPASTFVILNHTYDPTDRRIGQTASDSSWWSYPSTAANISYTANALNQYTAVGSASPTYDNNGNLTCDGSFKYTYDAENRLTGVASLATTGNCASTPTTIASYAYDAQGRRKSKTVGGATTIFVTDADDREVLEYNGSTGAASAWYAYGQGPNAVLNRMNLSASTRQTLIPDIQGSIVATLDSGTATLTKTGYQPFGENPGLSSGNFQYTAQRYDAETAGSTYELSGLYYDRARMYSPALGRFPQPDPIGFAGGTNLYSEARYGCRDVR